MRRVEVDTTRYSAPDGVGRT